jgi:uncharacterized membrane protein
MLTDFRWLFPWLLFAHVLGAIIAFGPTFAFPVIGRFAGAEPQHGNFAARVNEAITDQRVVPLAILQGITGLGIVLVTGIDILGTLWLLVAIVLYLIALGYALFVQRPVGRRIAELTSAPPPPGATGPPTELLAAVRKAQRGGMLLAVLIVAIVFLMVVKPF